MQASKLGSREIILQRMKMFLDRSVKESPQEIFLHLLVTECHAVENKWQK